MSWQGYIDDSLISSKHVDKGAIFGSKGDSKWAASPGFEVSLDEMKCIVDGLAGTNLDKLYADGLYVAGERYVLTKAEERSIFARKGKEGVVIVQSTQAILIAHYNKDMVAGNCSTTVQSLADYLIEQGF